MHFSLGIRQLVFFITQLTHVKEFRFSLYFFLESLNIESCLIDKFNFQRDIWKLSGGGKMFPTIYRSDFYFPLFSRDDMRSYRDLIEPGGSDRHVYVRYQPRKSP